MKAIKFAICAWVMWANVDGIYTSVSSHGTRDGCEYFIPERRDDVISQIEDNKELDWQIRDIGTAFFTTFSADGDHRFSFVCYPSNFQPR